MATYKQSEEKVIFTTPSGKKITYMLDWTQDTYYDSTSEVSYSKLTAVVSIHSEVAFTFAEGAYLTVQRFVEDVWGDGMLHTFKWGERDLSGTVIPANMIIQLYTTEKSGNIYHARDGKCQCSISSYIFFNGTTIEGTSYKTQGINTNQFTTLKRLIKPAFCVNSDNPTDEDNPKIEYENPMGPNVDKLEACIAFLGEDGVYHPTIADYREIEIIDTFKTNIYTFELTDAERAALRKTVTWGNTSTIRYYIKTTVGGEEYLTYQTRTLTLVNHAPMLSPEIKDVGSVSVALTNNPKKIIKYFNVISYNLRAEAKKEAYLTYQSITCGDKFASSDKPESLTGNFSYIETSEFVCSIQDSRGIRESTTVTLDLVEYFKPTCSFKLKAPTTDGDMNFTMSGSFFNDYFGDAGVAQLNQLTLSYRIKINDGEYGSWVAIPRENIAYDGNNYDLDYTISGLDYLNAYTLEVMASDSTGSFPVTRSKRVKTTPVYDWSSNDFRFNVNVRFPHSTTEAREVGIYGAAADGTELSALVPCNMNNDLVLGYGGYKNEIGSTAIMGNNIRLGSKNKISMTRVNSLGKTATIFDTHDNDNLLIGWSNYDQQQGSTSLWGNDVVIWTRNDLKINNTKSLLGLYNAMTSTTTFLDSDGSVTATPGPNYTSIAGASVILIGNQMRLMFLATRSAAASGDIANEKVVTLQITHGGKIKSMFNTSFGNGGEGGLASFYTTNYSQVSSDTIRFDVMLAATTPATTTFSVIATIPITINPEYYV